MRNDMSDKLAFTQNALSALNDIDQAMSFHMQWLQTMHRTLICRQAPQPEMLTDDSHLHCQFGQWYAQANILLKDQPGFDEVGEQHREMHARGRDLLRKQLDDKTIDLEEYDAFMRANLSFRSEAQRYQNGLINLVCVVDHLTGAWNRYAMTAKIAEESERAQRTGQPCSLCILDLDHFKQVNDEHGHLAGDLALQGVARFLAGCMRKYDHLFRFGGEEFLICLPNTSLAQAENLIDRMRVELAAQPIDIAPDRSIRITASFGVTELVTSEHHDFSIDRADHALLCAKANGRDCVCSWPLDHAKPRILGA